jgi:hypothetical protein
MHTAQTRGAGKPADAFGRVPAGFNNRAVGFELSLCGGFVLADEAAEDLVSDDPLRWESDHVRVVVGRLSVAGLVRTGGVVKSVRGAVAVFRPARFLGPLPEPAVRLSPQRALRKSQVGLRVGRIGAGPLVQLRLDLQYPSFRVI